MKSGTRLKWHWRKRSKPHPAATLGPGSRRYEVKATGYGVRPTDWCRQAQYFTAGQGLSAGSRTRPALLHCEEPEPRFLAAPADLHAEMTAPIRPARFRLRLTQRL